MTSRVLITGANGFLGLSLLRALAPSYQLVAAIRSERAEVTLRRALGNDVEIRRTSGYRGADWAPLLSGVDAVVHSVGILKESASSRYQDAHEDSVGALVAAASPPCRLIYISLVGADAQSTNPCLASKGRAEARLQSARPDALVLRLPMILGGRDPSSRALRAQAKRALVPLLGGGEALDQPIDVRDVARAVTRALDDPTLVGTLDLVGPGTLSYRALLARCAALYDRSPRIVPIPAALARAIARILERLSDNPAVTDAMLGVLLRDDHRDPSLAAAALGFAPRPLDETLRTFIGPEAPDGAEAGA